MSALHSKAPLIAPKKREIKLFPIHFSFHLHSFTVHQRESAQPDTQGLFPLVIRQVLRPDRKPVFHSPLPCLITGYFWSDTALMLVMTSPLQNHLASVTQNKGYHTAPWQGLWPWDVLLVKGSPAPTISNSAPFVRLGTRAMASVTTERIIHQLWSWAFMNFYLFISASSCP